jgi:hypothetical protein
MRFILLFFILLSQFFVCGQSEVEKANTIFFVHKNELGVNATNILGNLLSLNPNNINSPYGLTYRRHFGKSSLRIGVNGSKKSDEDFNFNNGFKNTKETSIFMRLGLEWHNSISSRFMFSYGFDVLADQFRDFSEIRNFDQFGNLGTIESTETNIAIGGGPILRFDFKFNDRISISTESSFYYKFATSTDKLLSSGQLLIDDKSNKQSGELLLPNALFVNIAF